ncbi:MAG TPA: hypothetical protein H9714_08245 [Candidatus Flavonifractor intestinipullorum]|uniref:Uncharacterized protein n=1 Tax=Candidatus Flavonifractor intestinipullorum TaxID=2838587 RepID=A0A9D2MBD2_9FIRM|nr:hypothetical protein [Candidatus Flavonifractor intestinipullorum]
MTENGTASTVSAPVRRRQRPTSRAHRRSRASPIRAAGSFSQTQPGGGAVPAGARSEKGKASSARAPRMGHIPPSSKARRESVRRRRSSPCSGRNAPKSRSCPAGPVSRHL